MNLEFSAQKKLGSFDFNLDFKSTDRVLGIFGPSGNGKSTLLKVLSGLITPEEGEITVNGKTFFSKQKKINLSPNERKIGYIFQEPLLFPHLNVKSNLLYGYKRTKEKKIHFDEVAELLALKPLLKRMPYFLSGGETQRVLIGRALLTSPDLLILDEPLSALDFQLKDRIFTYLDKIISRYQIPLIYVSHSLNEIMRLTDKVLVLKEGKNIAYGNILEVIDSQLTYNMLKTNPIINHLEGEIAQFIPNGMTEVNCYGKTFKIRLAEKPATNRLLLKISSKEIILSCNKLEGISARNLIQGKIVRLAPVENNLLCHINIGKEIIVEITHDAKKELNLTEGVEVYCLIKSNSIQVGELE